MPWGQRGGPPQAGPGGGQGHGGGAQQGITRTPGHGGAQHVGDEAEPDVTAAAPADDHDLLGFALGSQGDLNQAAQREGNALQHGIALQVPVRARPHPGLASRDVLREEQRRLSLTSAISDPPRRGIDLCRGEGRLQTLPGPVERLTALVDGPQLVV